MGFIALVRCVLVLRCGLAGVVWCGIRMQVISKWPLFIQLKSSLFIILQVQSTCFGCQPHPTSGVHKTVTTISGTGRIFFLQLPPSNMAKVGHVGGR